jgi:hypothetical protein
MVTEDLLAGLFGVDDYYVASAAYSTSKMGGTDATGYIFPEGAWLGYVAKSPGLYAPSAGYTFNWKGLLGGAGGKDSNWGIKMKNFRMEHLASDRIEGEMAFDMKKIAADLGVFFSNPIQ